MSTNEIKRDVIGREILLGSVVAMVQPNYRQLVVGIVKKFSDINCTVEYRVGKETSKTSKHPRELVLLDSPEATMYLLKYGR